jgi:hypothetical protein
MAFLNGARAQTGTTRYAKQNLSQIYRLDTAFINQDGQRCPSHDYVALHASSLGQEERLSAGVES